MGERLDGWKAIAAYLGRDVRTIQRWEHLLGLPVRRVPGSDKPHVFALRAEVDAWLLIHLKDQEPRRPSVAVLPFANLSGDEENRFFSDGLADDIIDALTGIKGLHVIARTSSFAFREADQDIRKIGKRLGADVLLEGSVRRDNGRVRVSAQLVSATSGYHLWSQHFDRDVAGKFEVQAEIARAVAKALGVTLMHGLGSRAVPAGTEAYRLWMKGRCAGAPHTPAAVVAARECFEEAIRRDPRFPMPYVSLAELLLETAHFDLGPALGPATEAKEAVQRALEIDETLGEAHALMGALHCIVDFNWDAAEQSFVRAIGYNAGSSSILRRYAWYFLLPSGLIQEARQQAWQALLLDPVAPMPHSTVGLIALAAKDYPFAIDEFLEAISLAPGLWWAHWLAGSALILDGRLNQGMSQLRKAFRGPREDPRSAVVLNLMSSLLGRKNRRLANRPQSEAKFSGNSPLAEAWLYLAAGDDRVFEFLDRAIDSRHPLLTHLGWMPIYDPIRGDQRFTALLARMGLSAIGAPDVPAKPD